MKKLLLLLVGVLTAYAANAALYVRGNAEIFGSWNKAFDYEADLVTYGTEKWYTFEAPEGNEFQISKTKGGDDWTNFNSGILQKNAESDLDSNTKQITLKAGAENNNHKFTFNNGYKYVRVKEDHSVMQISKVPFETEEEEFTSLTIYYDNSVTKWSKVNIHYFDTPSTSGTGTAMDKVEGTNYYTYTWYVNPKTLRGFLFNDGSWNSDNNKGHQTADYLNTPTANHIYKGAGGDQGAVSDEGEYVITDPVYKLVYVNCNGNNEVVLNDANSWANSFTFVGDETDAKVYVTKDGTAYGPASNQTYNGGNTDATYTLTANGNKVAMAQYLTGAVSFSFNATTGVLTVSGGEVVEPVITHTYKIKTNLISDTYFTLNEENNYTFTYDFAGNETGKYLGMEIDGGWQGASNASVYNGTAKTYTMTQGNGGDINFASNLKGVVTFVFDPASDNHALAVSGGEIFDNTPNFVEGNTYYINPSACGWMYDGGCGLGVKVGETDVTCTKLPDGTWSFVCPATVTKINVYRVNGDGHHNAFDVAAPTDGSNLYTTNSNFDGGSWSTYTEPVIPDDPDPVQPGTTFFIKGSFSNVADTPIRLVPGNTEGDGTYQTAITCTSIDGYGSLVIYSETVAENGTITYKYWGSNGNAAQTGTYEFNANSISETANVARIDVSALNAGKVYNVVFHPTSGTYGYVMFSEQNNDNTWYLTGDINMWSDMGDRNTNSTAHFQNRGFFSGEEDASKDYFYLQDDPNNPWLRFKSKDEMQTKWKFDFVGPGPEGTTGDNWYRLNLAEKGAADLAKHVGRLGGQFKITKSNLKVDADNYGINESSTEEYWKRLARIGEEFQVDHKGAKNIMIEPTVIENAVIWWNPTTQKIFLLGDRHDLYVYYANKNYDGTTGPKVYLQTSEQLNQDPHEAPFLEKNGTSPIAYKDGKVAYDFSWHKYVEDLNDNGEIDDEDGVYYYPYGEGENLPRVKFPFVWRKKIPSSIIHRTPMSYLTSVKPYAANEGEWFPRVRINCDDIWFTEETVNVFFRFADANVQDSEATEVFYNVWVDQYDAAGNLTGEPRYLFNDMRIDGGKMDKLEPGTQRYNDLVSEDPIYRHAGNRDLSWFVSPVPVSSAVANAGHAMFITSYGGEYPTNLSNASTGDRKSVELNGADLYYVVGGSSSRVGILYSHLKGTVAAIDNVENIQIEAEFFARNHSVYKDNELNTTIGSEVDYSFSVKDYQGNELLTNYADQWFDEPYAIWNVKDLPAGLYTVNVTVRKFVDGAYEYYSTNDIYPIYGKR